ncbi:MAG: metalloregulator ArsR/SmtB family transcription factor [Sedimentisphaerales bacterium]|nr:metalloregulator ArsR/SmtB family transcription factor [Sedimentisphaerales bacterium]
MDTEAKIFKVLADPTRLRLAVILAREGETCVCRLAQALGEPDFKISRHLGILRNAGLVQVRREGTWMYYQLCHAGTTLQQCLHDCFRGCLAEHEVAKEDWNRLQQAKC